ncbi:hypothetical protein PG994_006539 [Apiospora phragmitis]|uniref:Uncharacterized protein n=1 Tax=Apiospora phragmitis TaxID=2905665 RepID=A0ABR1VFF4_9PEZI
MSRRRVRVFRPLVSWFSIPADPLPVPALVRQRLALIRGGPGVPSRDWRRRNQEMLESSAFEECLSDFRQLVRRRSAARVAVAVWNKGPPKPAPQVGAEAATAARSDSAAAALGTTSQYEHHPKPQRQHEADPDQGQVVFYKDRISLSPKGRREKKLLEADPQPGCCGLCEISTVNKVAAWVGPWLTGVGTIMLSSRRQHELDVLEPVP